jgi:outer membrane protein OmpA-like peptidoglycan-associated protein
MIMMKRFFTLIFVALTFGVAAQDDDNLVPNGDFEAANTKTLKTFGQLDEISEQWYSATKAPADIFSAGIKSDKVNVPNNGMGVQDAASGSLYAGFRAYSKDKKLTRTYVAVPLTQQLEKNQMYCVEFKVSLSDLSKFGTNFVGAIFTDRKAIQPNTGPIVRGLNEIHVLHRSNKTMVLQDGWETVCGTFVAQGKETQMIIGGFGSDTDLQLDKMKRPAGVTGVQVYDAYYFLDDVKVYAIDAKSQCSCDPAADRQPDLIYGQSVVLNESMTAEEIVSVSSVYYAFLKKNITQAGENTLGKLIEIMNANPKWKLEVIGHCDNDEFNEAKITPRHANLGQQRAEQVVTYLASKGIDASRLIPLSKENTDPANERPTDLSRAQNRRVVFLIRK